MLHVASALTAYVMAACSLIDANIALKPSNSSHEQIKNVYDHSEGTIHLVIAV